MDKHIATASLLAREMPYSPMLRTRVACVLLGSGGEPIGSSTNSLRTHPMQAKWSSRAGQPLRVRLHAEIGALVRAKGEEPTTAIVVRVNKAGEFVKSFPCPICLGALQHFGCREIVYWDGLAFRKAV